MKIGFSKEYSAEKLDRRVSVAPMMDWTDTVKGAFDSMTCASAAGRVSFTSPRPARPHPSFGRAPFARGSGSG
jgi:hypothetical protein